MPQAALRRRQACLRLIPGNPYELEPSIQAGMAKGGGGAPAPNHHRSEMRMGWLEPLRLSLNVPFVIQAREHCAGACR